MYDIKIYYNGLEAETIRGLTYSQMIVICAVLKRSGVKHKALQVL